MTAFVLKVFLPNKGKARQLRLQELATEPRTMVFYEAPHRVRQTLSEFADRMGEDRQIVMARELTKRFEEFWRGSLQAAIIHYQTQEPKGEFTLVLEGYTIYDAPPTEADLREELQQLLAQGWSKSRASRQVAQSHTISRRHVYQLALEMD